MELRMVHLQRNTYGDRKGHLEGSLEVTTRSGDIKLRLTEDRAEKILALVADQLVEQAKEVANNITRDILEHDPNKALEDNSDG